MTCSSVSTALCSALTWPERQCGDHLHYLVWLWRVDGHNPRATHTCQQLSFKLAEEEEEGRKCRQMPVSSRFGDGWAKDLILFPKTMPDIELAHLKGHLFFYVLCDFNLDLQGGHHGEWLSSLFISKVLCSVSSAFSFFFHTEGFGRSLWLFDSDFD